MYRMKSWKTCARTGNLRVSEETTNAHVDGTSRLDIASPGVNFLMKSDIAVLIMTGSPTRAIHGADRLTRTSCPLSPCLSTLFKKISTPSDRHRGMTFRPPWAFCVLKSFQKTSSQQLGLLIFEKGLYIVKIVKNKLLRKCFFT